MDLHNPQEETAAYVGNQVEGKSEYMKYYCKNIWEKFSRDPRKE